METKRIEEISKMAENIVKKLTPESIGHIGELFWSVVIEGKDDLSSEELREIETIANDPEDDAFPEPVKQFLLTIINNPIETKYFVSKMQECIVKDIEEDQRVSDDEIEQVRDFFTIESLKNLRNCCSNRSNDNIKKLIIAVLLDEVITFEECPGISGRICELFEEIPQENVEEVAEVMFEAYNIIYDF